jgi:immune inhibitor A
MSRSLQFVCLVLLATLLLIPTLAAAAADDEARIAAARPQVRDALALAQALRGTGPLPRVARTTPLKVKVGDIERFWVHDPASAENAQIEARLLYAGPHVLMYVDTAIEPDQNLVEQSAREFEEQIYVRNRQLFGPEQAPGIDGDPRLTILNTTIRGAGGYFSPDDSVVRAANRFSNERDMFVIDLGSYPLGTDGYLSTLAHEFQHMIHESRGPGSASWFDEGFSTLAEDLNGYVESYTPQLYLSDPDLQLTDWDASAPHYGMSRLFMRYLHDQYAGDAGLAALVVQDAGDDLDAMVRLAAKKRPDIRSFADLFGDWAVANLVNSPKLADGRYAYKLHAGPPATLDAESGRQQEQVAQFGVDYINLVGPLTLDFDGADSVGLTGARPAEGQFAWWSNRGDQQVSTLTRAIDLRRVKKATLRFKTRYEIELDYDYAFVSVSEDAGKTWKTLRASTTTTSDPQGANFGHSWTGVSGAPGGDLGDAERGRWVDQQVDLTAYAGRQVQLRFWYVTDAAINGSGLMIDDLRIPEIGLADGFERGEAGWSAAGFVRVGGQLQQRWVVRLVRTTGRTTTVETVKLDPLGRGRIQLAKGERGVLVISGATRYTTEPAEYTYTLRR